MKRGPMLAALPALVVIGLIAAYLLRGAPPTVDPESAALWERVQAANRAWLDPAPTAITIRVDVLELKHPADNSDPWRRKAEGISMADEDRNARFLRRLLHGDGSATEHEHRYARGAGGEMSRVPLPPSRRNRPLRDDQWLAARIGTPLWTSMHMVESKGVPPGASIERQDNTVVFRMPAPPGTDSRDAQRAWQEWATFGHPQYGILLDYTTIDVVSLAAVEWELDARTLHPRRLLERSSFSEVVVEFGEPWLACGSGAVPQQITVTEMGKNDLRRVITYEMQCAESAWVVERATKRESSKGQEIDSLAERVEARDVSLAPLDPSWFALPTDVELPERSYTMLKPGERVLTFDASDGLKLEAKLSLPPEADKPVPVAMLLPGSGPWTFDRPVRIPRPDRPLESVLINYLDLYAAELTARGVGFFRANKRGCAQIEEPPHAITRREIFSKVTPAVLLDDYAAALEALRRETGVDAGRVVLIGLSEGTVLAPRLALRSPDGVVGLVLCGYAQDNTCDTIVWQTTVGPWRNVARVYDLDDDDRITKAEWSSARPDCLFNMRLGGARFEGFDRDGDGLLEPADLEAANAARLDATLTAVEKDDDEWLWWNLLYLNAAHLKSDWTRPPLHNELLRVRVPIHIIHGTHDGAVRVEGVREAQAAFEKAGRSNLSVHILPRGDHDLDYGAYLDGYFAGQPTTPPAMQMLFDLAAELAKGP